MLILQIRFFFVDCFFFFFFFTHLSFFFLICSMEGLFFMLLLFKDMNKLFKFYWKKETQMLILQIRFFC